MEVCISCPPPHPLLLTTNSLIGEGNGNPLQGSCLQNPRDRGAWWATVYGVAQSRTQLKWLSSTSSSLFSLSMRLVFCFVFCRIQHKRQIIQYFLCENSFTCHNNVYINKNNIIHSSFDRHLGFFYVFGVNVLIYFE